jgi:hypothetical protein
MLAYDHVRRLADAGYLRRVAMTRGHGSLLVLTAAGAAMAGVPAARVLRSVAPTTWAHTCACAWTAAWLDLRLRTRWATREGMGWCSEREVLADDRWRRRVHYEDRRGQLRVTHRPDLIVWISGRPVAVEVELQRKTRARLRGILEMYRQHTSGPDPVFGGVMYVTGNPDVARALHDVAADAGLAMPALSVRALDLVVEQARDAARELAAHRTASGASR